jgi:uncharacterized protein with PQ loop repeat
LPPLRDDPRLCTAVREVWRTRSTEDISLGMFLVMVLGILLWLLYGLLSEMRR